MHALQPCTLRSGLPHSMSCMPTTLAKPIPCTSLTLNLTLYRIPLVLLIVFVGIMPRVPHRHMLDQNRILERRHLPATPASHRFFRFSVGYHASESIQRPRTGISAANVREEEPGEI
jgi:hypothetical protein